MDSQQFEKIEAYLRNQLSKKNRKLFEQALQQDPSLKQILEQQKELLQTIEPGDAHQYAPQSSTKMPPSRKWGVVIILSLIFGIWFTWSATYKTKKTPQSIFDEYYQTPAGLTTIIGLKEDDRFDRGMVAYKQGRFSEAISIWHPLLDEQIKEDTLSYYLGISYLATQQIDSATVFLEGLRSSEFQNDVRWYETLLLLKKEDLPATVDNLTILSQQSGPYQQYAEQLLQDLILLEKQKN